MRNARDNTKNIRLLSLYNESGEYQNNNGGGYTKFNPVDEERRLQEEIERIRDEERAQKEKEKATKIRLEVL